jgi:putative phosphonate catabolism associated alcohol dehydrogenase
MTLRGFSNRSDPNFKPKTTSAAVFSGPGQPIELRAIPVPDPIGTEVLVQVIASTLCGSDLHSIRGARAVPLPTILGHEILGKIVEFGPEAARNDQAGHPLQVGDRVTWAVVANCGDCFYCQRSLPQKCQRQIKYGHEPLRPGGELTGGLAGHCLLAPGTAIFKVPETLTDATACPANCATATIGAAIEAAGPLEGRNLLVMGAGMLGLTTLAWADSLGAVQKIACDTNAARQALAKPFGASQSTSPEALTAVVLQATQGQGVDVAFELTGSPEAFEALLPLVRIGGVIVLVGAVFPSRAVPMALEQIVRRCLTIRGIHNYAPWHLKAALDFLESARRFPFQDLVAPWRPLVDLAETLDEVLPTEKARIGIRPF